MAEAQAGWLPALWDGAARWHRALFVDPSARPLPEMLLGTLLGVLISQAASTADHLDLVEACVAALRQAPGELIYGSDPVHLAMVARLLIGRGMAPPAEVADYLRLLRDALDGGAVAAWQVPALALLLQADDTAPPLVSAAVAVQDYPSRFGEVLGRIEVATAFGTQASGLDTLHRTLLYAAAARAVAVDDVALAARAVRCLHYVSADAHDARRTRVLVDALGARQEPEGHFGPHDRGPMLSLATAFACLWTLAEVSSGYRLMSILLGDVQVGGQRA